MAWYAAPKLAARLRGQSLLESLARGEVPVLLPTGHGVLRARLDHWFERHSLRPRVAGEFEDSALLKTFGAGGMGLFPAATLVDDELVRHYGVQRVGDCEGVEEQFFAITPQKKIGHPLVRRITGLKA